MMGNMPKTIGIKLRDEDLVSLNIQLKTLGYESLSDLVHTVIEGRFSNAQLVEVLADKIAELVVEKVNQRLTSTATAQSISVNALNCEASQRVMVGLPGFEPGTFRLSAERSSAH